MFGYCLTTTTKKKKHCGFCLKLNVMLSHSQPASQHDENAHIHYGHDLVVSQAYNAKNYLPHSIKLTTTNIGCV